MFRKHSFSKTQLVKPTFFNHVKKNTLFQKKVSFLLFLQFPLKPLFLLCFLLCTVLVQKEFWPKQIVCMKMRFFSLPDTNSVRQFLLKIHVFDFSHFWMTTLKKTYFYRFFWSFPFYFSFFYFSNIKKKKTKNAIFFSKTSFLITQNFAKTLF